MDSKTVIDFWFSEIDRSLWFKKNLEFDEMIRDRFIDLYGSAKANELFGWRNSAQGRLAEIIVLDQFSRNLFRHSAEAFSCDALALCLAQEAILQKLDTNLNLSERCFLYMPFMHSESLIIHKQAVKLFSLEGLEDNLRFEHKHKAIIEQFGRYPHRNKVLGRQSTEEEIDFLKLPGSSF